jgi:hypothetical protein
VWPALPASTTVVTPEPTPKNVRINAKGPKAFHEMEMNVDQSGGDDMVFDVDHRCAVE